MIDSIPWPDLDRDWGDAGDARAALDALAEIGGTPETVYRGDIPDRDFKSWSMGFYRSKQSSADNLEGFHHFLRNGFRSGSKEDEGTARKALLAFREGKWHAAE